MNNWIVAPDFGIQETYISISKVGKVDYLFDKKITNASKELYGAGTGPTKEDAKKYAEFEAIERIANAVNVREVIVDTYSNLKHQAVDMTEFPSNNKYENSPNIVFDENELYSWIECVDLHTQQIRLIPQNYVYLYNDKSFHGDKITNPISTGAALHEDYIQATINGIYEVIERDGIALTWLLKRVNGRINHLFNEEEQKVFSSPFLGEVNFYDVSTVPGIITVCAHAKSNFSNKVKNVLMFAADTDFTNIKRKLKKELISVMFSFSQETKFNENVDYRNFVHVDEGGRYMAHDFNDHVFDFFKQAHRLEKLQYSEQDFKCKNDELKFLVNTLKSLEMSVYVTDMSCREVLEKDFKSVKVIIPQLQPISFVYRSRFLDTKRIKQFAKPLYGEEYLTKLNHYPLAFS